MRYLIVSTFAFIALACAASPPEREKLVPAAAVRAPSASQAAVITTHGPREWPEGSTTMTAEWHPAWLCSMPPVAARVRAEDVDGGVAIVFETEDDVSELRSHVHNMARTHDRLHERNARATVDEIPEGARIVLIPRDPSALDELRRSARERVERMNRGDCPARGTGD